MQPQTYTSSALSDRLQILDPQDPTWRTVSFACFAPVTARHIGFAIGPFEHVDLTDFREMDEDDKLGQNAIKVDGFCLPGRAEELRNTCMPMAKVRTLSLPKTLERLLTTLPGDRLFHR